MDIDNMTIGQARQIAAMFGSVLAPSELGVSELVEPTFTPHIGKKCIIRTYASGVFFGTVTKQSDRAVEIADCRRLWKWHAEKGISLSDVAVYGIDASKSRICSTVLTMTVLDALEIIPASADCIASVEGAPVASK